MLVRRTARLLFCGIGIRRRRKWKPYMKSDKDYSKCYIEFGVRRCFFLYSHRHKLHTCVISQIDATEFSDSVVKAENDCVEWAAYLNITERSFA